MNSFWHEKTFDGAGANHPGTSPGGADRLNKAPKKIAALMRQSTNGFACGDDVNVPALARDLELIDETKLDHVVR